MQVEQIFIDGDLFNMNEVKGSIISNKLPDLYKDYLAEDQSTYYYIDANNKRIELKEHEIYVFHSEYYMVLCGGWVRLSVIDKIEGDR